MTSAIAAADQLDGHIGRHISPDWGDEDISLYLGRCQVDTPMSLVRLTWREIVARRERIGKVVDFGAGDGRFACGGRYSTYVGYEIDWLRRGQSDLPPNASIVHRCAFSERLVDADVCIGNPPFVRNQDLPSGWRKKVADELAERSGVRLSGYANAWQYFFLLSLLSLRSGGLCALVVPYEWVSRPSAAGIRDYIRVRGWHVDVYRVADAAFGGVLTTSSVTLVDTAGCDSRWRFFAQDGEDGFIPLRSESGSDEGHLPYVPASAGGRGRAMRGLSPGSQRLFTCTEPERARNGFLVGLDVVPCVTSLRPVPENARELDLGTFERWYRSSGERCWLLRLDAEPSERVRNYLDSFAANDYATSTCLNRRVWWRFKMPETPGILVATSFKGPRPKVLANQIGAKAVGGVAGVYGLDRGEEDRFIATMSDIDLSDRIVAHAKNLRKIEINQLNALIAGLT